MNDLINYFKAKGIDDDTSKTLAKNLSDSLTTDQLTFILDNEMFLDSDGLYKHLKVILLQGQVRSGKTWISQLKFVLNVMMGNPNSLNLISGVSASTIEQNVLQLMQNMFGTEIIKYRINKMQAYIKDPNGVEHTVLLRSFYNQQAIRQIQGLTLDKCLVDEAEHASEAWYNMLYQRCCLDTQCIYMTLNPSTPGHWINKNILQKLNDLPMIKSYLFLLLNNNHISDDYKQQLAKMYRPGTAVYRQLILGEWASLDGACFPKLLDDCDDLYVDFDVVKNNIEYFNVGVDWGGNKSCTVITLTATLKKFSGYIFVDCVKMPREKLGPNYILDTIVKTVKQWMVQYKTYRFFYCYADCADQIMVSGLRLAFQKSGIVLQVVDSYKPKLVDKINMLNIQINLGLWYILKTCPFILDAWQQIVYDKDGDIVDTNLNNENDIWDSQFYSIGNKLYWQTLNKKMMQG